LEQLDKIPEQKRVIAQEAVQKVQNFNAIEDLMGVV
jgi:hypothetical protein